MPILIISTDPQSSESYQYAAVGFSPFFFPALEALSFNPLSNILSHQPDLAVLRPWKKRLSTGDLLVSRSKASVLPATFTSSRDDVCRGGSLMPLFGDVYLLGGHLASYASCPSSPIRRPSPTSPVTSSKGSCRLFSTSLAKKHYQGCCRPSPTFPAYHHAGSRGSSFPSPVSLVLCLQKD